VPKNSPLRDVLRQAMGVLFSNGTYKKIMTKWGITANVIGQPGINLGRNTKS